MKNIELQLANDFVQHTGHNIFLTGKAGTGKTTFLHTLKQNSPKRMIVTAPTGVAAINAGGVTLHSFFQLPFGPYLPDSEFQQQAQQRRMSREKINIIKGLDLLVIDEISMVRADLLDAVDAVLRRYKHQHLPFGGVQLLMIGDLHQLSPVVKDDEWNQLKRYYDTCYFFSCSALKQTDMISIELKHIYRQSDAKFIQLLNQVRNNRLDADTIQALNTRHKPEFEPDEKDDYITLTTHNRSANNINDRQLQALKSKPRNFQATIEDDFPAHSYPTAETLILKKGAQVMFIRNDSAADKLYFNGKIGKISHIDHHCIKVQCPNDNAAILVEPVTWENIKYTVNTNSKEITEEIIGTFTQYPLRLAWAITIHKSQGLTFERAIIDANAAFSHGQVYVALSRCKTFEGMILSTPISQRAVKTDRAVSKFVECSDQNPPTQKQLKHAKIRYQQKLLIDCFEFKSLSIGLENLARHVCDKPKLQFSGRETIDEVKQQLTEQVIVVADKFRRQLQSIFTETLDKECAPENDAHIQDRVQKASAYFIDKLQVGLVEWLSRFTFATDNKEIRKKINQVFELLQHQLVIKKACLRSCRTGFSSSAYLNAVAHAELDSRSHAPGKQQAADVAGDVQHPALLQMLKAWRTKRAGEDGVEHFQILHQRILIQIAMVLPGTLDALLPIKGIGKYTAEKYGKQLTDIVNGYCREHGIIAQVSIPKSSNNKQTKQNTKQISYELYLQGKNIKQIASERGLVTSTIEGHLAHYVNLGQLDITDVVTESKIANIKHAIHKEGSESLKLIKDQLGDDFSYGEIRLVLDSLT